MRVAFLGLGIMGHAMATNISKAGHEVAVWNRTAGKQVEGARANLQTILDNLTAGVIVFDRAGLIDTVNPGASLTVS